MFYMNWYGAHIILSMSNEQYMVLYGFTLSFLQTLSYAVEYRLRSRKTTTSLNQEVAVAHGSCIEGVSETFESPKINGFKRCLYNILIPWPYFTNNDNSIEH